MAITNLEQAIDNIDIKSSMGPVTMAALADKKWEEETFEKIEQGKIAYYDFGNPETSEKFEKVQIEKSYEDED